MRHATPIADVMPGFFDHLTASVAFVQPRRVPFAVTWIGSRPAESVNLYAARRVDPGVAAGDPQRLGR
jgi:hypothetical protein